jgi:hypothetical protein
MQENSQLRKKVKDSDTFKTRLRGDLYEVLQFFQDPKQFKDTFKKMYNKYVGQLDEALTGKKSAGLQKESLDEDIHREYQRQIEHLEKTVHSLKHKLHKDSETHKSENGRIMSENVALLKEINELRREMKSATMAFATTAQPGTASGLLHSTGTAGMSAGMHMPGSRGSMNSAPSTSSGNRYRPGSGASSSMGSGAAYDPSNVLSAKDKEIDIQRTEIQRLRTRIEELEDMLARQVPSRPFSRERLPPMEGFQNSDGTDGNDRPRSTTRTPGSGSSMGNHSNL